MSITYDLHLNCNVGFGIGRRQRGVVNNRKEPEKSVSRKVVVDAQGDRAGNVIRVGDCVAKGFN